MKYDYLFGFPRIFAGQNGYLFGFLRNFARHLSLGSNG